MPAATIGYCFSCDKEGIPVSELGAVVPAYACQECRAKHGWRKIRDAVNRLIANRPAPKLVRSCKHCGGPVLADTSGMFPLMCETCWRELKQIGREAERKYAAN